jgi:Fe-S cluster assembly ATPase SufC
MTLQEPKWCLDETDSGGDVDAMKLVAEGVNNAGQRSPGSCIINGF